MTVCVVLGSCTLALAQTPDRRWELEVHVGRLAEASSGSGTAIGEFPRGTPILGGGMFDSRAVSSWYFGDGSVLFNQVAAAQNWSRITPLDPALRQPLAKRKDGAQVGVRLARHLTSRLAVEFNVDYAGAELGLTDEVDDAIEATRASFVSAWRSFTAATVQNVTSVAEITQSSGRQVTTSGTVRVALRRPSRFVPYVTAGAGGLFLSGAEASAALNGSYRLALGSTIMFNESDSVVMRAVTSDKAVIGIVGGGFTYDVTPRHGLRADVRLHVGGPTISTVVDATPSVVTGGNVIFIVGANPSIRFSNIAPILGLLGPQSSLSGPRVEGLETFAGSGRARQVNVTVGYVVRF